MKTAPTAEQIARLPKWARSEIQSLTYALESAEATIEALRLETPVESSEAVLDPYVARVGLGKHPQVRHLLDGPDWIDTTPKRDTMTGRRYVEILASTGLQIEPQASNLVRVYLSR